ncbi:hypothetical protein C2S51_033576 [Perilla frutescens var. frutescens]|nr:hypothetical protein C2S51_033576 [Perilla frutescens var. frutescens]
MRPSVKKCDMIDRLSALPDPLILMILSLLPTRNVVQTSILSRRWNYLWIKIPCLRFSDGNWDTTRARNFIQRTLMLWNGPQLREFQISFGREFDAALHGDLDLWILFAKTMKVEELDVRLPNDYSRPLAKYPVYSPPLCLYRVQSLKYARLIGFSLENVGMVQWDQLCGLELVGAGFTEDAIIKVLAGCPQLSRLRLGYFGRHQNMSIRSNSLRELYVNCPKYSASKNTLLSISAPNLVEFQFVGAPHTYYLLSDVPSLSFAGLQYGQNCAAAVCGALRQIMPSLAPVVNLQVSHWCSKSLVSMRGCSAIPTLLCVKVVRITGAVRDLTSLAVLKENFPNMDTLKIDWDPAMDEPELNATHNLQLDQIDDTQAEAQAINMNSAQFLLTTVHVTCPRLKDSICHLMEYMWEHIASLEKMVIGIRNGGSGMVEGDDVLHATSKLLLLQRVNPTIRMVLRRA